MKRTILRLVSCALLIAVGLLAGGCASDASESDNQKPATVAPDSRVLVAYFSATGNTERIATYAADALDADVYVITPEVPYTAEDFAINSGGRCDVEQDNLTMRPGLSGDMPDVDNYDVIMVGYPIWHNYAPRIICTFLENLSLDGKVLIPFCTSNQSDIDTSEGELQSLNLGEVQWMDGRRFAADSSAEEVEAWLEGLGFQTAEQTA